MPPVAVIINRTRIRDLGWFRRQCFQAAEAGGWELRFLEASREDAGLDLVRGAVAAGARLAVTAPSGPVRTPSPAPGFRWRSCRWARPIWPRGRSACHCGFRLLWRSGSGAANARSISGWPMECRSWPWRAWAWMPRSWAPRLACPNGGDLTLDNAVLAIGQVLTEASFTLNAGNA